MKQNVGCICIGIFIFIIILLILNKKKEGYTDSIRIPRESQNPQWLFPNYYDDNISLVNYFGRPLVARSLFNNYMPNHIPQFK